MIRSQTKTSYDSVVPTRARRPSEPGQKGNQVVNFPGQSGAAKVDAVKPAPGLQSIPSKKLKSGHSFSYIALFAFTLVLYARPSEFYPSPVTASIALVIGIMTLAFFVPTQFALEGNLSVTLPEVKLILLFALLAVINVPLAMSPADAAQVFTTTFIRCVAIFIVMVNVASTPARLKGLLFLGVAAAIWLGFAAINDYRSGLLTVEGYRAAGRGTGIFGNTNDMALHLVTMFPIVAAAVFGSRKKLIKIASALCAILLVAAIVLSYSRGAFIGLIVILVFFALKLGNQNRVGIVLGLVMVTLAFLMFAPGGYGTRLLSIFVPSLDPVQSADARRGELFRSLYVAIRHPFFGIGMGNYAGQMSLRGLVTHNSYTQVASEMGVFALGCYVVFMVSPLRKLGQIVRETTADRQKSPFFYLALGVEGALIGYMVSSFFLSVPYVWYVYYLVGYAVCVRRIYEADTGRLVVVQNRKIRKKRSLRTSRARTAEA
ncbi:MAG TPA: O-antigen ligase family protein [Pyrinomonadaceae bacterium]|nr:O-antigen ligase family protein [Pyrinomonadaceae bacterium]